MKGRDEPIVSLLHWDCHWRGRDLRFAKICGFMAQCLIS